MTDEIEELFDEITLDEVVEKAAGVRREAGEDLSPGDVEAARARAKELVDEARQDPESGLLAGRKDMQNLALSIGLPVPRALFDVMIDAGTAPPARKKALRQQLPAMSPVTETGCIRADFFDTTTQAPNVVFLVLEACDAAHDLGAQLDKIYGRLKPDKREEIRNHLSMLVYLGRTAYGQMLAGNPDLVKKLLRKLPAGFDPHVLNVDPANTTLFLGAPCDGRRVGIFVRLESEVGAENEAAKNS